MKILVSACIMGVDCKYNGKNNKNLAAINYLKDKEIICICPEQLAGMATPRPCAEIVNGVVTDEMEMMLIWNINEQYQWHYPKFNMKILS